MAPAIPDPLAPIVRWLVRLLCGALALLMVAMVVMVFGNVVLRYVLNAGITVSEELSRWCFVWLTFLGVVIAVQERAHLGSDLVVQRLGPAGRRACLAVSLLLMLGVDWLIFRGSLEQVRINATVEAPVTGAPMAVVYAAGVVYAVLAGLLHAAEFVRLLTGRIGDDALMQVQESEDHAAAPLAGGPETRP